MGEVPYRTVGVEVDVAEAEQHHRAQFISRACEDAVQPHQMRRGATLATETHGCGGAWRGMENVSTGEDRRREVRGSMPMGEMNQRR